MAEYTIDPGTVVHTFSDHAVGVNLDGYANYDFSNQYFRSLVAKLNPEIMRIMALNDSVAGLAYTRFRPLVQYLQQQLGSKFSVLLNTTAMPTPGPFASGPATSIAAAPTSSVGYSPTDHANYYAQLIGDGTDVRFWEFENEEAVFGQNRFSAYRTWFEPYLPVGNVTAQYLCEDWANIRLRDVMAVYRAKAAALSHTTKTVISETFGLTNNSGYQWCKATILGKPDGGATWSGGAHPYSGNEKNIPWADLVGVHTYGGGLFNSSQQGALNSYFWDGGGNEAAYLAESGAVAPGKGRCLQAFRLLRALLDANGGSAITFGIAEGGGVGGYPAGQPPSSNPNPNPLYDIAQAVMFCQYAPVYKLEWLLAFSCNRSAPANELFFDVVDDSGSHTMTSEAEYLPNRRYYTFRDFWGAYLQTCKRQVQVTTVTQAANTPATPNNNPVPSIQVASGITADGSQLWIQVVNLSLTTAEQVKINILGGSQGAISGKRCPLSQGSAPLATIAPFGSGVSSFTTGQGGAPVIAPGDSFLFVVPRTPGQPAPPPTGDPHIGNWTAAVQINAGGIVSPPAPDQHLGNWTAPIQLNAAPFSVLDPHERFASYKVEVAWSLYVPGIFVVDRSTVGGADALGGNTYNSPFGGPYDDITLRNDGVRVISIDWTRGRSDDLSMMQALSANIVVSDPNGMMNKHNLSSPLNVGNLQAGALRPLRPVRASAYFNGQWKPILFGFLRSIDFEPNGRKGTARLEITDLFAWLETPRQEQPNTGPMPVIPYTTTAPAAYGGGPMTTGVAIGMLLDWIGWTDASLRRLDVGDTIPFFEATGSESALTLIQNLLAPNLGSFWIDPAGVAVYEDRNTPLTRPVAATIENEMHAIGSGVTLDTLRNKWTVTRQIRTGPGQYTDSTPQVASDALSAGEFGERADTLTTPFLQTDAQALGLAQRLVSLTKDPVGPLWQLAIDNRTSGLMEAMLDLDLHDRVTASEAETGTEGTFFIEQGQGSADGRRHSVKYILTDRQGTADVFIVGTDVLDGAATLAF